MDCEAWRGFLKISLMLPFCAGLLEGNNCFARSGFDLLAPSTLTARPNMASAIEEYDDIEVWALGVVDGLGVAFQ